DARDGGIGCELFEMDVSEREGKLQRHRCKREPSAPSSLGPNPTHHANRARPTGLNLSPRARRAMASEPKPFGDCVMDPSVAPMLQTNVSNINRRWPGAFGQRSPLLSLTRIVTL